MPVVHLLEKQDYNDVRKCYLVVIHFYADWVEQCKHMNDVLDEVCKKEEYKDVIFTKILAEQVPEVSLQHKITAVPTFVILHYGKDAGRVEGANPSQLTDKLNELIKLPKENSQDNSRNQHNKDVNLEVRLQKLINAAPVMVFMSGTAADPKSESSKKMVDVLKSNNIQFKTFDILNDEQVRNGLKLHSNCPNYPQLYINGKLVGSWDTIETLVNNGEFKDKLPQSALSAQLPLEDRLKALIRKAKIMVFMKGNRTTPRCGFSRQLIEILKETGLAFETFDILEDEEVRQGLKTFSNWPTYPQVYVNGELVGGLDIIKEHLKSDELLSVLNP